MPTKRVAAKALVLGVDTRLAQGAEDGIGLQQDALPLHLSPCTTAFPMRDCLARNLFRATKDSQGDGCVA